LALQQDAWLSSSPDELKGKTRFQFIAKAHGDTRAQDYLVDPGPLEWLVDLARDAGLPKLVYTMNGSHAVGLDWADIVAWIDGAEMSDLHGGWRRDIMMLSRAHANTANAAREFACQCPFEPE